MNGLTIVGGPTKLSRVAFYLDSELKEKLEELARKKRRTLSNLMAVIAEEAIKDAQSKGEID